MALITVRISASIVRGGAEIEVAAGSVAQLLQALSENRSDICQRLFDEAGRPRRRFVVFVNGKNIRYLEGLETALRDGDEVYIMPIASGG